MSIKTNKTNVMKCVVPNCIATEKLFRVPNAENSMFKRWTKVVDVLGLGDERICHRHFPLDAFIENSRTKLKSTALPSLRLPDGNKKAYLKRGCCIKGCSTRKLSLLEGFPSHKCVFHARWLQILGISNEDVQKSLRICRKHFTKKDFVTVRTRYLKPNVIPSRNLVRPLQGTHASTQFWLHDHTYCKDGSKPRSNRSCFVVGCTAKSSKGIILHSFPTNKRMANVWLTAVKTSGKVTKSAKVCSQHFHDSDYRTDLS
ncbi:uncharacterized protein LOC134221829 [Armigeres subalbatus]|uniref:uncharacterized protein LOC134221829 n=1 Tax=Armigeres subalbatus TaxID=124917 RepID=UPI002ED57431